MKKLLIVFGTRPEAIKMAPLVQMFKREATFDVRICVTGQHRQMLDQVLNIFNIVPEYDLNIMKSGQDLYDITSSVLYGMRKVLEEFMPAIIFVHGDTTTSTAAALSAFYKQIPVAHIEAGLRTYNIYSPWPEEVNRQLTSRIATYHFAPTETAKQNLISEQVNPSNIFVTGNTVIDALLLIVNRLKQNELLHEQTKRALYENGYDTQRLENGRKLILITGHRRENFGSGLERICVALKTLANKYADVDFVYPLHLNPNVRASVRAAFPGVEDLPKRKGWGKYQNIYFINPLEYIEFVMIMEKSHIILTDSGGIQEEAPSIGKPVLVMRNTTERPEAIKAGSIKLVGTNVSTIVNEVSILLNDRSVYEKMSHSVNPYGNGHACEIITQIIKGIK